MLRSFGSWTPFKIRQGETAAMLSAAIPEDNDDSTVAITSHADFFLLTGDNFDSFKKESLRSQSAGVCAFKFCWLRRCCHRG